MQTTYLFNPYIIMIFINNYTVYNIFLIKISLPGGQQVTVLIN